MKQIKQGISSKFQSTQLFVAVTLILSRLCCIDFQCMKPRKDPDKYTNDRPKFVAGVKQASQLGSRRSAR